MVSRRVRACVVHILFVSGCGAWLGAGNVWAADQSQPGAGNAAALQVALGSPRVRAAKQFLVRQAEQISEPGLRMATLDILRNPASCALHRRGLQSSEQQDAVVQTLFEQGLINEADAKAFASGVRAGVFPPLAGGTAECPQLPQRFESAPGSVFGGHHSYPGGLPVHEANNDLSDANLWVQYQARYGSLGAKLPIERDVILAAPIWHDWAKTLVFQWNADGTEFEEFNFGGNGSTDAWGAAGDSRTGGHHILSLAESMARGLSPLMVITQASAHSAPTLGNEYKVVNWLRAAATIARLDPLRAGYLVRDANGRLRLPPIGHLADIDLPAAGQTNLRVEYVLHNLSDADYTYSGPAVSEVDVILKTLAPEFGFAATDALAFNTRLRNPALAHLGAERLQTLYAGGGLDAVRHELQGLRRRKVI